MSIVGGVRDIGVGTDTEIYTEYYFQLSRYISSISDIIKEGIECDRGYLVLNWISHLLGDKPQSALFLSQLFSLGLIFSATYKISNHIGAKEITSFTILFCFMYYNMTYNYMRQFCALSLLIWGLYYIVKNKWWHYVAIQVLAYFFHTSSVIFIVVAVFYIIVYKIENKKMRMIFIICVISVPILFSLMFYTLLPYFMNSGLVTEVYADRYGTGSEYDSGGGLGIRKSIIDMTMLVVIFLNRKVVGMKCFQFQLVLFISYFAISLLSIYVVYLSRLSFYFSLPLLIYFASNISLSKRKMLAYLYFAIITVEWYIMYIKANNCETYPYKSTLLGI